MTNLLQENIENEKSTHK